MEFKGTKGDWFSNEEEFKTNITLIKHSKEMFEALNIILQELRDINVLENQANYIEQLINKATTI